MVAPGDRNAANHLSTHSARIGFQDRVGTRQIYLDEISIGESKIGRITMFKNKGATWVPVLAALLLCALLIPPARSQDIDRPAHVAPPLRGSDGYRPQPLDRSTLPPPRSRSGGLKAVAIVGDVGDHTSTYKNDMNVAVKALQNHGVAVEKFYYGERTFTWSDIVAAATDAHFLLYMGHGIWWGGSCTQPTLVGGFSLGDQLVHPDDIRNDLAGRLADDSVVILSHACFSAGDTSCDGSGQPSQDEAERRVRMYAAPFVDIGMEAYFANNYFYSAANIVNQVLADISSRKNVGEIFKSVYPYNTGEFRDLTYPDAPGYDLWLSGATGHWSDAFVGIPDHVFRADVRPELGQLPTSLAFTYNTATAQTTPASHTLAPANVSNNDSLTWDVTTHGDWFTVSPSSGSTSNDQISVALLTSTVTGLPVGHHTGAFTVTITDPPDTLNGVQRIDLGMDVIAPRLGSVPQSLRFTYFLSETLLFPSAHHVAPENAGSDDTLTWQLAYSSTWFTVSPTQGETPAAFAVTPADFITTTIPFTYTGAITVAVVAPEGTRDPIQTISVTLCSRPGGPVRVYLPVVARQGGDR
jgi:hypothetical protein